MRKPNRFWLAFLIAGGLATQLMAATANDQYRVGEIAPSFVLKSVAGDTVSLDKPDKQWLVLQFVATWCPISNQKIGPLQALYQQSKGRNVRFVAIDVGEDRDKVRQWVTRHQLTYPMLLDDDGKVAASYAPKGVKPDVDPADLVTSASLIIDPHGVIRYFQIYDENNADTRLENLSARLKLLLGGP